MADLIFKVEMTIVLDERAYELRTADLKWKAFPVLDTPSESGRAAAVAAVCMRAALWNQMKQRAPEDQLTALLALEVLAGEMLSSDSTHTTASDTSTHGGV